MKLDEKVVLYLKESLKYDPEELASFQNKVVDCDFWIFTIWVPFVCKWASFSWIRLTSKVVRMGTGLLLSRVASWSRQVK